MTWAHQPIKQSTIPALFFRLFPLCLARLWLSHVKSDHERNKCDGIVHGMQVLGDATPTPWHSICSMSIGSAVDSDYLHLHSILLINGRSVFVLWHVTGSKYVMLLGTC